MNIIHDVLNELNPWWSDPNWYKKDNDITQVYNTKIERRIRYRLKKRWLESLNLPSNNWGIRVIRGPRRIGKTTLMKLLIKDAIDLGMPRKAIVYLTLDNVDIKEAIERKNISLRKLLRDIIIERKKRYGKAIIILDEATFYNNWALVVKNLVDEHVIGPGVLLLVTGSYSLELSQAKRELEGRMGTLGEDSIGQQFLFPMRYIEFIENISKEVNEFLRKCSYGRRGNLFKISTRLRIFEELTSFKNYNVLKFLETVYDNIGDSVISYLEDLYFYSGGFPRAMYYVILGKVPDEIYVSFYELLVQDAERFGLSSNILKELIRRELVQSASFEKTLKDLQIPIKLTKNKERNSVKLLKASEVEKYLYYLTEGSKALFTLQAINPISGRNPITYNKAIPPKIIYSDPLIFHSLYWISRDVKTNIHETAQKIVVNSSISGASKKNLFTSIYEATVCSHIIRIPTLKNGVYVENYGRGKIDRSGPEYADCISWYFDKRIDRYRVIPVEVSIGKLDEDKIIERAKLARNNLNSRLIVASRKEIGIVSKNNYEAIIIPAALLLLFT